MTVRFLQTDKPQIQHYTLLFSDSYSSLSPLTLVGRGWSNFIQNCTVNIRPLWKTKNQTQFWHQEELEAADIIINYGHIIRQILHNRLCVSNVFQFMLLRRGISLETQLSNLVVPKPCCAWDTFGILRICRRSHHKMAATQKKLTTKWLPITKHQEVPS